MNNPEQPYRASQISLPLRSFIGSVYIPTFLIMLGYGMILPVIPLFAGELGAGLGLSGLVLSMHGIGSLLFDLPAGGLVARFGEKRTMLAASACTVLVAAATGFSYSIIVLALLTMAMGSLHALWMISVMSCLRRTIPQNRRGRGLSLVGGVFRISVFLGPIAGGLIGRDFGLRFSYFAQALATAPAFLMLLFSGHPLPP
ncbi:MAG: MFS transporter, partial [Spirochaeta sp.]|nr:MFS transporter [Spirochaeta sp.]